MGFAGAGWPKKDHVVFGGDEVQGAEVGDHLPFEAALMVEIEVFDALAGGEAGGSDPILAAMVLAGCHLPFQAGRKELFVGPAFLPGPFRQPVDRRRQGGSLQCPTKPGQIGGRSVDGLLASCHQTTPRTRS